jgi:hypothetical protein
MVIKGLAPGAAGLSPKNPSFSPVAQQVERVAVNHLVGGSSPSRGARKSGVSRFG